MRIGIAEWQNRISPVFDVARSLEIIEVNVRNAQNADVVSDEFASGHKNFIQLRHRISLDDCDPFCRAERIGGLGIDILICGAVSRQLMALLNARNIRVISNICGPVENILQAFIAGKFDVENFAMPGCGNRRRHRGRESDEQGGRRNRFGKGRGGQGCGSRGRNRR